MILISKVFDGISDLWAGNLIDHTRTKAGRARPGEPHWGDVLEKRNFDFGFYGYCK